MPRTPEELGALSKRLETMIDEARALQREIEGAMQQHRSDDRPAPANTAADGKTLKQRLKNAIRRSRRGHGSDQEG